MWMAGAAAAAVAVVGGVAFWQMNKPDPKDVVIDAFKGVVAEGQTNPMEEIFGWKGSGREAVQRFLPGRHESDSGGAVR